MAQQIPEQIKLDKQASFNIDSLRTALIDIFLVLGSAASRALIRDVEAMKSGQGRGNPVGAMRHFGNICWGKEWEEPENKPCCHFHALGGSQTLPCPEATDATPIPAWEDHAPPADCIDGMETTEPSAYHVCPRHHCYCHVREGAGRYVLDCPSHTFADVRTRGGFIREGN